MAAFTLIDNSFSYSSANATITSPTNALHDAVDNPFLASNIGTFVSIKGAGVAAADLNTTISAFTSSSIVSLTANSATSVAGVAWRRGDNSQITSNWTTIETIPFSKAIQVGDVLVFWTAVDPAVTISSVTDSAGNVWTVGTTGVTNADYFFKMYYSIATVASTAGSNALTVTWSATPNGFQIGTA